MGVQINGSEGNVIATKGTYSGNVTIGGTLTYEDVTNIDSVGIITARSGIEIGASPGVGASISVDGNAIFSGITTTGTVQVGSATTVHTTGIDLGSGNLTGHNLHSTGITTSSSVIVGGGVTISESGIEASGIGITCANINGGQISGRRNIIINGAMMVAQRGISTTSATSGYHTVDRFQSENNGADEAPTREQVNVSSSSTPYTEGFRKAYKLTNGNQTGGAGADDIMNIRYQIEGQDIAQSGWNYKSASSFVTLQFWIKSSVSQNFNMYLRTIDGTNQTFAFDTGTLSADTWTKIIKTIPGNSNIQIDNDNGVGLQLNFGPLWGTNRTDNSVNNDEWKTYASASRMKDNATTWYTTDNATLELTGLQLEVGSQATPFEHRSFGEELLLCQRYYQQLVVSDGNAGIGILRASSSNNFQQLAGIPQIVKMRTGATGAVVSSNSTITCRRLNGSTTDITAHISFMGGSSSHARVSFRFTGDVGGTFTNTEPYACWDEQHGGIVISQDAEL